MELTVVSSPAQGGTVTSDPASETGAYYPTANVPLTAEPQRGYKFVNWTGDVSQIEDPSQSTIVVPMHDYYVHDVQQIDITANFARQPRFPWEWLAIGLGASMLAALALTTVILLRRKKSQAETELP